MNILELNQVVKTYENHTAVDGVSFNVPKGRIFGLLGPNGAGKTSLIRIITTITRADGGTVLFNGESLGSRHPEAIGYMPEERGLYKKMKVGEHLIYLARLKGLSAKTAQSEIDYWLEKFGIADWWNKKIDELSKGMQQKIQFIATVIHKPNLLILDEPFSGLDPVNTNLIKDEIYQLNQQGTSIIFSTHRMEQVEEVCEEIVLINKGKNILSGSVKEVKDRFKENLFEVQFEGELPTAIEEKFRLKKRSGNSLIIKINDGDDSNNILQYLVKNDLHIISFKEILPTLNEIFIKQVGN